MEAFLEHASDVYAVDYFGIIIVVALLECVVPRRAAGDTLRLRWAGNFGLTIIGSILVRSLFPVAAIGWATFCQQRGWGLFNRFPAAAWLEFCVTLLALDVTAYAEHYVLHRVPLLWRLHRTHHTDHDYDFTTGVRFHPFETIFRTPVTLGAILAVGAPPAAVLVSQLLSVAITFIEHGNLRIPSSLDRVVKLFLVTPDMHRIHHSEEGAESRSNFATTFPWWDRLFGTYKDQPAAGHDGMTFGVSAFDDRKHQTLPWMLAQPFLREETRQTVDASSEKFRASTSAS
jgi:sterol desaturase/sphingolipid hydroxylase (fatty acid hydroxylase superfamily)